jgi:hypothetical protein
MRRGPRFLIALAVAFTLQGGAVRAQYYYPYGAGWAGGGFGGWGSTPLGHMAAGMGVYAAGAGQYNLETAQARSINANTAMQWNSYMWSCQNDLNRERYTRMKQVRAGNIEQTRDIQDRLHNNPNNVDIQRGDAENAILQDMTNPKILEGSDLAHATTPLPAELVKGIPFRYAPEMALICIDRIKDDVPDLLLSDAVKPEREAFVAALKQARAESQDKDEISPATLAKVRTTGKALWTKVETGLPDASKADRDKAMTYLRNLKALLKMLRAPDFRRALKDLDQHKQTTVGNLIAFMHIYNLRFGPAKTQEEQAVYKRLYPILRAERDKLYARLASGGIPPGGPPPPPPNPGEIFQGINDRHLNDSEEGR